MEASSSESEFPPLLARGFRAMTLTEVKQLCVERFSTSSTRREIFDGLCRLVERLNRAGVRGEIWLDGSFATEKLDPADVDILIQVRHEFYDNDARVRAALDWAESEERWKSHRCDAYTLIEYDVGNAFHSESERARKIWANWFGTSRKGWSKGIAVVSLPAVIP